MNQIYIRGNEIATKAYVDSLSLGGDGSALDNYYTKEEVNELIEENSSTGGDTNLTNYYTKEEINNIISETNNSIQVEEMPNASEDNKGTIVQYIGVTNENYTTSNFYQVVEKTIINEDGSETIIYVWEEISTPEINLDEYATKKYVDDGLANIGGSTNTVEFIKLSKNYSLPSSGVKYWDIADVNAIFDFINSNFDGNDESIAHIMFTCGKNGGMPIVLTPYYITHGYNSNGYNTFRFNCFGCKPASSREDGNDNDSKFYLVTFVAHGYPTDEPNKYEPYEVYYMGGEHKGYLSKTNTLSYTPTSNYHPATKKYVDDTIATSIAGMSTTSMEVATSLPTENISTSTIYLIKDETASTDSENIYNEYIYINGVWENIGSTKTTVDLSNYYTKEETEDKIVELISNREPGDNNQSSSDLSNYYTKDESIKTFIIERKFAPNDGQRTYSTIPDAELEVCNKMIECAIKGEPFVVYFKNLHESNDTPSTFVYKYTTGYEQGDNYFQIKFCDFVGLRKTDVWYRITVDTTTNQVVTSGTKLLVQTTEDRLGDITRTTSVSGMWTFNNPTNDLQPATKKYVDDIVGNINSILDTINGEEV